MNEEVKEIIEELKQLVESKKINISAFARTAGVEQSSIYKWIHGTRVPNLESYFKLKKMLKIIRKTIDN